MKIFGNSLQKGFLVKHNGKDYNYLDADYSSPALLNRNKLEVIDKNGEEVNSYITGSVKNNNKEMNLYYKLVKFCMKNFNHY